MGVIPSAPADRGRPHGEHFPRFRTGSTAEPSPAIFSQHRTIATNVSVTTSPVALPQVGSAYNLLSSGAAR
jgi:hypothetical protein